MTNTQRLNRRTVIKSGAAAIAMPALLGANSASAQAKVIKIGHVSPRTGPLAGFGEADPFILDQVRAILGKGLQSGGKTYKVEIISKDSQSSGSRAAEVASELILSDKVDLLITADCACAGSTRNTAGAASAPMPVLTKVRREIVLMSVMVSSFARRSGDFSHLGRARF